MGKRGHNEGSIYKRDDGRWVASLTLGYDGGTRKRKSFYGDTRKEVQEQLTKALRDQQQGLPMTNDRKTVEQFLLQWLAEAAPRKLRVSTLASYTDLIKRHIIPELGRIVLSRLGPQDVQQFVNKKLATGLSPRTVQYLHAILRRALGQALKWGLVARNVATLADAPHVEHVEVEPLTPQEARAFLDAVHGDRLEALYTVGFALGLRRGEALALRWDDIDFDAGTLRVRRALQRIEGKLQFFEPKTKQSRRTITLPQVALAALHAHRVQQLEERLLLGNEWQEHGLVFTTSRGTPIEPRNALRSFHAALKKAGIRHQRFHDTRHACASLLLAQGVQARVVMEILGHTRIGTTMDIYSHVMPSLRNEAASQMDAALGSSSSQKQQQG